MDYVEINFTVTPKNPAVDILIAELGEIGFESFVETDNGVLAYIPNISYSQQKIQSLEILQTGIAIFEYAFKLIKAQNWNAIWESSFEPIMVNDICAVHAPFHAPIKDIKYDIVIEPKMSFGTGHHETTFLMMEKLLKMDVKKQHVLDMGCGTAVLSILASKLGASEITAIDNDEWACNNAIENTLTNDASGIKVILGDAKSLQGKYFNTILANINRNILLHDMPLYIDSLQPEGSLVMSGFFTTDIPGLKEKAEASGLVFVAQTNKNNWALLHFIKY